MNEMPQRLVLVVERSITTERTLRSRRQGNTESYQSSVLTVRDTSSMPGTIVIEVTTLSICRR